MAGRPTRQMPPDPSQQPVLQTIIDQRVMAILADTTRLPDEFQAWVSSFATFNAVQSVTA